MIKTIKKKIIKFLVAWGIFLCLFGIAAIFMIFIFSPIITFFRQGIIVFLPSVEYVTGVVKSGVLGSFLAALVTWFWAEFFPNMKIK